MAGNIIPVDDSGQLYAPGLITTWQQGIGNDTEIYAVVGRYTETGQLQWSEAVQVTVDGVADTAFDLAVGQNGLMQLVTQKVLQKADPRKSEYSEDPQKFVADLKSSEQGDTDLYHAPLVIERNRDTGNLSLVLNPNISAPNNLGVQKEGIALNFPISNNIATTIQSSSIGNFLRISEPTSTNGFKSAGLMALAQPNSNNPLQSTSDTPENNNTPNLPAKSGPDYGFQINIGANASNVDGTSLRLLNLEEPGAQATGFAATLLRWFGADLGFDLSGSLGTRVNRDGEDDVYSVNAGFELAVSLSKEQKQWGANSKLFVDNLSPLSFGSFFAPSGISIGFGFSGSQFANEQGETTSLERFLRFRASIFKQASLAIPPLPPNLNGYFFQGRLNGKLTFELGRQVVYSDLLSGQDPPFQLDTGVPDYYGVSIATGLGSAGASVGTWFAYRNEINAGREGLGTESNIFAGFKTFLLDIPTAIPILIAGAPIYSPAYDMSDRFKKTQSGVGLGITSSVTGGGQALLGLLDAEATATMGLNFSFLTEPYKVTTFNFSLGIGLEAGIGPLTWGYDWAFETEATLRDDSPENMVLQQAEKPSSQVNTELPPMASVKLTYNPYQGSTFIHQNSRFNPIGTTQPIANSNARRLLTETPSYQIGSIVLLEGGSGYLGGETGSFLVLPSNGTAVLMAYVEKGVIQQVVVESPGSGYDPNNLPTLDFQQFGRGGTGASATVALINREVNDLVNDSPPFLDSINYLVGSSLQTSTALIWVADGADSTKPISDTAEQLTSRVKVATLSGNFWTIAKDITGVGTSGMNYDPVISWYLNDSNQPTLMAVWAHANVEGINSNSISESSTTLDAVLDTDLYYSTLDSFAKEWSAPQKLISLKGSDMRLDMRRTNDGSVHLAWVNCAIEANQNLNQTIYSTFFDPRQEKWSSPTTVSSVQSGMTNSAIASLKVGELEGQPALYWSNSADIPYFASVLNDSPVLYYRLEASDINQSEVNYGNLGTNVSSLNFYDGNMTFSQEGALGLDPDPAVQFNGQGAFVATPTSKENVAPESFSLEAWVKLTDTEANKGIISRGQPNALQATLPTATLTYKVTQKQDKDGKWFYFVTPEKVDLSSPGQEVFPNTLQVSNFKIDERLELPFSPQESFTLRAEPDEFTALDQIATGDIVYNIGNSDQTVLFDEDTLIRRRFEVGPGEYEAELIQLTVGQKIQIKGQTYILNPGETFAVSLKAGDEIAIFDNDDTLGVISGSLVASFNFAPDEFGSVSDIKVNSQQILSAGQGLDYKPFADREESFTLTADMEFEQVQDWYLMTGEGGKVVFNAGAGEINSQALNLNEWHHVVATYDDLKQESKLYINGEVVAQIQGERFTPSNNPILMGYNLKGVLDEIAIYNKTLTLEDPNAVQFDEQGKYIIALNPNPPAGEINTHYVARDVDPDSAQEATYSSVWNGTTWNTPDQFVAEFKLNPTQTSLSRSPAVDLVSGSGLQPDGLSDQHLSISLSITNKTLFGRTITAIEIKGINDTSWSVGKETQTPFGSNLIGVMLGGERLNDLKTGKFKHTVLGINETLNLYFDHRITEPNSIYSVTLTLNNGETIVIDDLAPSPNVIGSVSNSSIVKAEILEEEVTALSEVDSGVVIDIDSIGAGQSLVAGTIRNGQIGFAIAHPYQLDEDLSQKGLVWVLQGGSNEILNDLTGIPLKNDDVPKDGALIIGKNGDKIGQAMAVGDVDSDGIEDLIIGAPEANEKNGKIYVISGRFLGDGKTIDLASLPANTVITIEGTRLSNAGFALASGDVTGDGIADIVIGAPNALDAEGKTIGAVHVVSGKQSFLEGNPTLALSNSTLIFAGKNGTIKSKFDLLITPNDRWHSQVGYSVAVVQPGSISNPKAHNVTGSNASAHILIGAPGYHQTIRFDAKGKPVGISQAQLDQYKALLSHTPNSGVGSVPETKDINTGRAYLVYGGENILTQEVLNDDNLKGKGIIFDGSPLEDRDMRLGEVVTGAGDMNGDGYVDIALSAPEAAGRAGLVFIFGGRGGNLEDKYSVMTDSDVLIAGGDLFNYAGQSLAGVGDVNNDGIDDLLIGVPQAGSGKGQNFVIFGVEGFSLTEDDFPTTISLMPGIPDDSFVLNGGKPQGLAGYAVAKGFDLNGDTVGDMLLSAPFAKQVYVAFGHPWLKKEGSVRLDNLANDQGIIINRYEGSEPKYKFEGKFVSNLGDINGDGYGDMAVAGNGESVLIQFGGATWDLLDAGFGSGQLPIFLKKDEITDISLESVQGIGDINNDGFNDFIVYNSRSQTQNVHDYTIVYGGEYLDDLDNLTIDAAVPLETTIQDIRTRQRLANPGFLLGNPAVGIQKQFLDPGADLKLYKQSLRPGESIYSSVLGVEGNRYADWPDIPFRLTLEANGELKFYDPKGRVLWTGGKADAGIVKMEIDTLDGKSRLLFKDQDGNIVTYSEEYLENPSGGWIPYLRVGNGRIILSQRGGPIDREDKVIFSNYADTTTDDTYSEHNPTTVFGNPLPSLLAGEGVTSSDGKRTFLVMPLNENYRDNNGNSRVTVGLLELKDGRRDNEFSTKLLWSPYTTDRKPFVNDALDYWYARDAFLLLDDDGSWDDPGNLNFIYNDYYYQGHFGGLSNRQVDYKIEWSLGTSGDDLALHLDPDLNNINIVQKVSTLDGFYGLLETLNHKNLYGESLTEKRFNFNPAGDLNGDGFEDVITFDSRFTYIYFGNPQGKLANLLRGGHRGIDGQVLDSRWAVGSGIGDVNGNGYDDLLILSTDGVSILFGTDDLRNTEPQKVSIPNFLLPSHQFSQTPAIYKAGDLNGDGFGDFIVRDSHIVADSARQASRLVYGNRSGANFQSTQIQTYLPIYYPLPISGSGDVNGDGYDDIIFSDPSYLDNDNGRVYILFGGADLSNKTVITPDEINSLSGNDGFFIDGLPQSRAGESVSGGEDINGDGLSDFMIGAPGVDGSLGLTYALFGGDFTKSIHQAGTEGNDILEGTGTGDRMIGLLGNDVLIGNGGKDVLYGGAGDDELIIADPYFLRVDGGSGFNTLTLEGYKDQNWDLTTLSPGLRVQNISAVDLSHFGKNTVTLNKTTVIKMTDIQNNLVIFGDAEDEIILSAGFERRESFNFGGTLFDRYQDGTANVFVAPSIKTEVKFTANPENSPMSMPSTTDGVLESESGVLSETSPSDITNIANVSNGQPTQFYVSATPTRKDAGVFTFTVNRSGDLTTSVTALYQTINDTAIAGRDYVAQIGTLVFAPGEMVKTVEIELIDHDVYGGNNRSFGLAIQPVDDAFGRLYGSNYLQLQTEENIQIRNLDKGSLSQATAIELNTGLPLGAMNFNVTAPEDKVIVTIPFSGVVDMNSYLRFNPASDTYEEFLYNGNTGVEFVDLNNNGRTDTIKIHLMDGGRGDSDGVVNGIITGSNAPGLKTPGPMEVNPGVFYIPTNSDGALQLHSITVPENYQFGVVEVDDSLGTINSLKPTDSGYTEVALTRGEVIFDNDFGSNINALSSDTAKLAFNNPELLKNSEFEANGSFSQIELQGGKFYSFYLTENDTTEMSINNDNLIITPEGRGYHDIKWSSLNLEVGTDLLLTPGNTGEKVEAQIQIARAGSYNNTIALFKVDTLTGDLDIDGDGVMDLQPGGEGYVSEVFKRVQDPLTGVILPEMETIFTSKDISVNLDGGQMYGLALITNGKINQFLIQNPSNEIEAHIHSFFSFEKANPDGISHIRRLGENLWGFEDLIGGGDRDFNDMIVQVNF